MFLRVVRTFYLTTICIAVLGVSFIQAQSIKHKVQDEETLFSIAQEYAVTVKQLKNWNNLSGNTISIGQVLIIKQNSKQQPNESGHYTVKPNDTLFSIAKKFGISVDELQRWNNLNGAAISVGQVLMVQPEVINQPEPPEGRVENIEPVVQIAETADGFYTVKSGDTLFRIAQLFGMEVEKLKALNRLSTNNIHVGQELKVEGRSSISRKTTAAPGAVISYKLKRGMGLKEFLGIFEMTKKQFKKLNPDMKATYINKGQIVKIVVPKTGNNTISPAGSAKLTMLGTTLATKYSSTKMGTVTTNGELYNPRALTAAHASMAIGSVIFVQNTSNNRGVIIRINDRISENGLKLSTAAWQALGITGGTTEVTMYRINE